MVSTFLVWFLAGARGGPKRGVTANVGATIGKAAEGHESSKYQNYTALMSCAAVTGDVGHVIASCPSQSLLVSKTLEDTQARMNHTSYPHRLRAIELQEVWGVCATGPPSRTPRTHCNATSHSTPQSGAPTAGFPEALHDTAVDDLATVEAWSGHRLHYATHSGMEHSVAL